MKSNILIVGSGALATLFAARLSAVGLEVTMLGSWQEGLAALRKTGARLNAGDGQIVETTDNPDDCQGVNYALVLIKSWQTERGAYQLVKCLANDGLALTLQNGLGNDLILSNILGVRRVSRGVTTLGATLLGPGSVRSVGEGVITIERHSRLDGLVEMLRQAGFDVRITDNLEPFVWGKLVINAAINPLTAILRVKNGGLLASSTAHALMGQLANEVATVAEALKVKLPYMDPNHAVDEVALNTADNISSMLQDVLRGAQTEVEAINGAVVRIGEQKGISSPVNRTICSLVNALPVRVKI